MKKLRILVVVPYFYPAIGGVESYSQAVIESLIHDGHEVTLVTTKLRGENKKPSRLSALKIIRLSPWFRLSNTPINPLWYFQLRRLMRQQHFDVLHVHSPVPFLADMAVSAAPKQLPILMTYHAGSMAKGQGLSDKIITLYEKYVLPRVLRRVDKVGAVLPEFVKKYVSDSQKVVFTPPGIDVAIFKPAPKHTRKNDVMFAGRIEKTSNWKGLDILLRALALVRQQVPEFTAEIIGSGDGIESYRQLAKELGIGTNIAFIGGLDKVDLAHHYQNTKVFVLPSKTQAESFGMVLAEAMACEAAVIGSRIGGVPNVITDKETGLLVPPNNPQALAQKIITLLSDSEYRALLGSNARERIHQNFALRHMVRQNTELLVGLAQKEVVHISTYYPPHLGGMEQAIFMLTNKLHEAGRRVSVVTSNLGAKRKNSSPFLVKRLPAFHVVGTPVLPGLFAALLRESSRSIFHVHVAQAGLPEVAFLVARIKRTPLILHMHADVAGSTRASFLLPLYKKTLLGFILRRASLVIVPTENYKKMYTKRYGLRVPVRVAPTGIEEHFFLSEKQKNKPPVFTLLFAGRLSVEKNVALLIKAASQVTHPIQLIIVGDGPLRKQLEKTAREYSDLTHVVKFEGRKTQSELKDYYKKANAFLLASDYESQSLATLEAMACGVPVIIADVPAVNEIVGNSGMLVEKTVAGFTRAMTQLIEDPALQKDLAEKGKQRAREFEWSAITPIFEEAYDEL